jgi:hypothetical protein
MTVQQSFGFFLKAGNRSDTFRQKNFELRNLLVFGSFFRKKRPEGKFDCLQ